VPVAEIDALLDRVSVVSQMLSGRLTAESTPALNAQLREVFDELRVSRRGRRLVVEPRLRPDLIPPGRWVTLDFADPDSEGVEVVDYLDGMVEMAKIDLAACLNCDGL